MEASKVFFWRNRTEKSVAIKVLGGYNKNDPGIVAVISEELRNMSRVMKESVKNPHLVAFYGACFQDAGTFD